MPIQHAVLGLLAEGPSYGYELKANFEEAIGPQWGELNIGHLYQILDRLMRDRLVRRRAVAQSDRPDKLVYRLTKNGRVELDRWLGSPFVRSAGYRDDFFLKLLVAARLGKNPLEQVLRGQREAYLRELAALGGLRGKYGKEPLVSLLLEAALLHTEANLKIVERAEERIDDLSSGDARIKEQAAAAEAEAG
jgi:DNA-binding PadR family transcriptional regulator